MARLSTRVLEVFLLVVIFAISATITAIACSVTNRQVISSTYQECVTILGTPNMIYKSELNKITFSDGDFDNINVYGLVVVGLHQYLVHNSSVLQPFSPRHK